MPKNKHYKKLFILFTFVLVLTLWTNVSFAIETDPKYWPNIPFSNTKITADSQLPEYIVYFFALGIYLGGAFALISLALGGVQLIISEASPGARSNAIARMKGSVLGLILLVSSFLLVHTINPKLEKVEMQPLTSVGTLQLIGKGNIPNKPAQLLINDLNEIIKDYSDIKWVGTVKITDLETGKEKEVSTCDSNNKDAVYVIYWYKDKGLKNFWDLTRLKCGESINLKGANSYVAIKEQPGVYFYNDINCKPEQGSDASFLPVHSYKSIVSSTKGAASLRVVNGSTLKGPFFGVIYYNVEDYVSADKKIISVESTPKTLEGKFVHFPHFITPNNSQCYPGRTVGDPEKSTKKTSYLLLREGSYAIYQWAGFKKDEKKETVRDINCAVTLYSRPSWTGGSYTINIENPTAGVKNDDPTGQTFRKKLSEIPVLYPSNTSIPKDEQVLCSKETGFNTKNHCLQSLKISGDCLVLISTEPDLSISHGIYTYIGSTYLEDGKAQQFPISPRLILRYREENRPEGYARETGTPEIELDFITSASAEYIEVIPLAVKITD